MRENTSYKLIDMNDKKLNNGDIINIHQTINGQNEFIILNINPLDIRYKYDINHKYEYDKEDLLKPDKFTGESTYEIIGNINNTIKKESNINFKTWNKFFDSKPINEINIPLIKIDELLDNIDQADNSYKKAVSQKYKSYEQYIDLVDKKKHHFKVHDMSGDIMGTNAVTFDVLCFTDNDVDTIRQNIIKYCIGDFFNQLPETLNIFGINMNPSSYVNKQTLNDTFTNTISTEQAINTIGMITGFYYDKKIDTFNVWTNKPK